MLTQFTAEQIAHIVLTVADLVDADIAEHAQTGRFFSGEENLPRHTLIGRYLDDPGLLASVLEDLGYAAA